MLPSVLQSRLPRFPSLRRSASMYGISSRRQITELANSSTPKAPFASAVVLSGSRPIGSSGSSVSDAYTIEQTSSNEYQPTTSSSTPPTLQRQSVDLESKSGIGWKFANQGLHLLRLADEESSSISQDPDIGHAAFARQVYLHALTYLLRALPQDLTTEEQLSVRTALPHSVVQPLHFDPTTNSAHTPPPTQSATHPSSPSILHRTLASSIIQLFLLIQFLLPYLKYLLSAAYQYEREHKITEKVLSHSIDTVDMVGKRAGRVFELDDGMMAKHVAEWGTWVFEGVVGGVSEGVGEGVGILSAGGVEKGSTLRGTGEMDGDG